jgi:hypothetical protein
VAIYAWHFLITVALMVGFISAAQVIVSVLIRQLPWLDVLKVRE